MKPTAAPPWFPYRDHRTMAQVMAGDKPSEKLIERPDSAMESAAPASATTLKPGPDQNRLIGRQSMALKPDKLQTDSAQSIFGRRG